MADPAPSFACPKFDYSPDGWGPTQVPEQFVGLPYAPFFKGDRLGRSADFSGGGGRYGRHFHGLSGNDDLDYQVDLAEDSEFQLVDTAARTRRSKFGRRPQWVSRRRPRSKARDAHMAHLKERYQARTRFNKRRYALRRFRRYENRIVVTRESSVQVTDQFTQVAQMELSELAATRADPPTKAEDYAMCGKLEEYNDEYDRVRARGAKKLQPSRDVLYFSHVPTRDDPVLERAAREGQASVFATDVVLAQLMAAPRSVLPWDLLVTYENGQIFLDKRPGNNGADTLTVHENAALPNTNEDEKDINSISNLSEEAYRINRDFRNQVMRHNKVHKMEEPNPFWEEEGDDCTEGSVAFRYRKFHLADGTELMVRTEVHGVQHKAGGTSQFNAFALNEWDPKQSKTTEWRGKIDNGRAAVLAAELKNNANKLARWTAQSLLSGADTMRLGFVTRADYRSADRHNILAVQAYKPIRFAHQIALTPHNIWGVFTRVLELVREHGEGQYVIMRDPNDAILRVYSVPPGTFRDEE